MNTRKINNKKAQLKLNQRQRNILVGLILGDAHLETQNKGRTYRIKFEYSVKQSEYANYIYEIFREWIITPPQIKKDETHNNIWFQTISHPSFRFYAQQFYKNGKKCVPKLIHRFLTNEGIAFWFMDDGSIKSCDSKGVIFNTQGFLKENITRLIKVLQTKFELIASERRQKDGFQIYISGKSYDKFRLIVDPNIHPTMRYKIPNERIT